MEQPALLMKSKVKYLKCNDLLSDTANVRLMASNGPIPFHHLSPADDIPDAHIDSAKGLTH